MNVIVLFLSTVVLAYTEVRAADIAERDCIYDPNAIHTWTVDEALNISYFVPPQWRTKLKDLYLNVTIGNNLILNLFLRNGTDRANLGSSRKKYFVHFPKDYVPKIGWNSMNVYYVNGVITIMYEDKKLFGFNSSVILLPKKQVKVKGMFAFVNCNSNLRTFAVRSDSTHPVVVGTRGADIPLKFHNNKTTIVLYSKDKAFEVQLLNSRITTSSFICKNEDKSNSENLVVTSIYFFQSCRLIPNVRYHLNLDIKHLLKVEVEKQNSSAAVGFVELYESLKDNKVIYVQTDSEPVTVPSFELSSRSAFEPLHPKDSSQNSNYYRPLIIVSSLLSSVLVICCVSLLFYKLRRKGQEEDQLKSSESWTQQNFDSVSSDLYIRNETYNQSTNSANKKISLDSNYSNPLDDEYEEPCEIQGRNSIYESVYASSCLPPRLPNPKVNYSNDKEMDSDYTETESKTS